MEVSISGSVHRSHHLLALGDDLVAALGLAALVVPVAAELLVAPAAATLPVAAVVVLLLVDQLRVAGVQQLVVGDHRGPASDPLGFRRDRLPGVDRNGELGVGSRAA